VRVGNELDRLALVRPGIVQRTEDVVDAAEEDRMLHRILATPVPGRAGPAGGTGPAAAGRGAIAPWRGRWRAGWAVAGAGLTAAATALAVGIVSVTAFAGAPPARQSARKILLAAAANAAAGTARAGFYRYVRTTSYWYVRTTSVSRLGNTIEQTWTRPNGQTWTRGARPYIGLGIERGKGPRQFSLTGYDWMLTPGMRVSMSTSGMRSKPNTWLFAGMTGGPVLVISPRQYAALRNGAGYVTFGQLQQLPASPAALEAWLLAFQRNFTQRTGLLAYNRSFNPATGVAGPDPVNLIQSLAELVAGVPAPPRVRAAAFRVLATLPNVTSLGLDHSGNQVLRVSLGGDQHATLIIDPVTSQTREILTIALVPRLDTSVSVSAQWVNRRP
jgi:hypothetical protein